MAPRHERDNLDIEQAKLRPDIEVIREYGGSHPESWVEVRYENEPSVRIAALFAGDELETHQQALTRLVSYPDQLVVRPSPWPRARLEEIREEVDKLAMASEGGVLNQWGVSNGKVNVRLRADSAHVAQQLCERYGEAVDLTVGSLPYPDPYATHETRHGVARRVQSKSTLPDELQVAVDDGLEVTSGGNLHSKLYLHNRGQEEVVVNTNGVVTARVVDPDTHDMVGGYSGAQTMPLVRFRAPAGESVEIPLLIGTASNVPRLGYAVPPGRWAITATLSLEDRGNFETPLLPITVVP